MGTFALNKYTDFFFYIWINGIYFSLLQVSEKSLSQLGTIEYRIELLGHKNLYLKFITRSLGWEAPLEKGTLPTLEFWLEEFCGQRPLAGYSPWDHKELTPLSHINFHNDTFWVLNFCGWWLSQSLRVLKLTFPPTRNIFLQDFHTVLVKLVLAQMSLFQIWISGSPTNSSSPFPPSVMPVIFYQSLGNYFYGILLTHKQWNTIMCNNMDGPREYYASWNKSDREGKCSILSFILGIQKKKKETKQN